MNESPMRMIFYRNFEKKFIRIPSEIRWKFKQRRNLFLESPFNPLLHNHPLTGDRKGEWSMNITGDWRVIYIWRDENTAIFLDIDTHSNLYE